MADSENSDVSRETALEGRVEALESRIAIFNAGPALEMQQRVEALERRIGGRWQLTYRWLGWREAFAFRPIPNGWRFGEAWVALAIGAFVALLAAVTP